MLLPSPQKKHIWPARTAPAPYEFLSEICWSPSPRNTPFLRFETKTLGQKHVSDKRFNKIPAQQCRDTRSPPAKSHQMQNEKWPLGGPKMADGVWKGVYPQVFLVLPSNFAKGSIRIKKCHKKWKKSTRGGVSKKHPKVQNSKFGLLDKRGGRLYFHLFPKCKYRL